MSLSLFVFCVLQPSRAVRLLAASLDSASVSATPSVNSSTNVLALESAKHSFGVTKSFLVVLAVSFGLSRILLFCIQGNGQLNGLPSHLVSSTFVQRLFVDTCEAQWNARFRGYSSE